jgi:hypothetical protein
MYNNVFKRFNLHRVLMVKCLARWCNVCEWWLATILSCKRRGMHLKFNFHFNELTLVNCTKKLQDFFFVCYVLTMWYLQASQIPPSSANCNCWFSGWLINKLVCIFKPFYGGWGLKSLLTLLGSMKWLIPTLEILNLLLASCACFSIIWIIHSWNLFAFNWSN